MCLYKTKDSRKLSRRTVLQTAATSAVATGVASSGVAARSSELTTASRRDVENRLNSDGESVVAHLKNEGYVRGEFEAEIGSDDCSSQTRAVVEETEDDSITRAVVETQNADYAASVHLGQDEAAYAVVYPKDGSDPFVVEETDGEVGEETHGCTQSGVICTSGITCGDLQVRAYERIVCLSGRCYRGSDLGCKLVGTVDCKSC